MRQGALRPVFLVVMCAAQLLAQPYVTQWCDSSARCKEDGDTGGWCDIDTWKCKCSAGYGPLLVEGEWRWFGCYAEVRQARVSLAFARGSCEADGSLAADVPAGVVAAVEAAAGSTVSSFSYACGAVTFVMTLDVPAANVEKLAAADLQAEVVRLMSTELQAVLGAVVAVQSAVSPSTLPDAPAPAPETPAPTADQPLACTTVDNAVLAFVVILGDTQHCTATKCKTGYVLDQRHDTKGFDCVASTTETPCLVSGDCTWDALKPRCDSGACATSPPPPSKTTKEVRRPTSYVSDFCSTNADCQLTGDTKAVCVATAPVSCACGPGYHHLTDSVPLCVSQDSIQLGYSIYTPSAPCSAFNATLKAALLTALQQALGDVTTMHHTCGATFGLTTLTASVADACAGQASLRDAFNAAAAADTRLAPLGMARYARLSHGAPCDAGTALRSVMDGSGVCHALACPSMHEPAFETDLGRYVCVPTPTLMPGSASPASPTLEITALAVGAVVFVVLVILVAASLLRKGCGTPLPPLANEPDSTV